MKQDNLLTLSPTAIKIREDMPRVRNDLGEIEKLIESIKKFGQLQPIVITRDMELIAGGRRLAACTLAGINVKATFNDAIDPVRLREIELEENIQRKDLTPAEEVLAIKELHELKQSIYGIAQRGPTTNESQWTEKQTAAMLGKTQGSINQDLALARAIESFPSLSACKSKAEMRKTVKGLEKLGRRIKALQEFENKTYFNGKLFTISQQDAVEFMSMLADNSIDVLLTDPPYGIEIDKIALAIGSKTGGDSVAGFKYEDTEIEAIKLMKQLAKESYRFCKYNAHAYVFTAPTMFEKVKNIFEEIGWIAYKKPIIWAKQIDNGQTQAPQCWPASCYEMILFCRKIDSRLTIEGKGDWIPVIPISPDKKNHQAEKPISLLKNLLERVALPGALVVDPFMGSGSSLIAALELKMIPSGCDKTIESYATALERLQNWNKENEK